MAAMHVPDIISSPKLKPFLCEDVIAYAGHKAGIFLADRRTSGRVPRTARFSIRRSVKLSVAANAYS
jgi:hypothetical protein